MPPVLIAAAPPPNAAPSDVAISAALKGGAAFGQLLMGVLPLLGDSKATTPGTRQGAKSGAGQDEGAGSSGKAGEGKRVANVPDDPAAIATADALPMPPVSPAPIPSPMPREPSVVVGASDCPATAAPRSIIAGDDPPKAHRTAAGAEPDAPETVPRATAATGASPSAMMPSLPQMPAVSLDAGSATLLAAASVGSLGSATAHTAGLVAAAAAAPASTPLVASPFATPGAQLQPVLLRMAASGGSQQMTVTLHPIELGRVEVRLDRDPAGGVQVAVSVERPETLHALLRDQARLGQALDRAGLSAEARDVSFRLVSAPVNAVAPPGATPSGAGLAGQGGDAPRDGTAFGDSSGFRRDGGQQRPDQAWGGGTEFAPGNFAPDSAAEARWTRLGIDITA